MGTIADADVLVRHLRNLPAGETMFTNGTYKVEFDATSKVSHEHSSSTTDTEYTDHAICNPPSSPLPPTATTVLFGQQPLWLCLQVLPPSKDLQQNLRGLTAAHTHTLAFSPHCSVIAGLCG